MADAALSILLRVPTSGYEYLSIRRYVVRALVDNKIEVLNKALDSYGTDLFSLLDGISVDNEHVHRLTRGCDGSCADAHVVRVQVQALRSNLTTGRHSSIIVGIEIGYIDTGAL